MHRRVGVLSLSELVSIPSFDRNSALQSAIIIFVALERQALNAVYDPYVTAGAPLREKTLNFTLSLLNFCEMSL